MVNLHDRGVSILKFWTQAEPRLIKKTLGASLRNFRPDIPTHEFIGWDNELVEPSPGEIVIACGGHVLGTMQAHGKCPKNRTVTSMREKPISCNGGHYMVTFDPAITQSDPSQQQIIDWDIRLAHRLLTTGSIAPKVGKYRYVASFASLIERIKQGYALTGKAQDLAFDLETMTFWPWYEEREIVTAQFTYERETADVLYCGSQQIPPVRMDPEGGGARWQELNWLLTSPMVKLRGANAKFDLIWAAEKWDIECTNLAFDTCLVGSLLDENRSNSLNLHAKLFTPLGGYDDCVSPETRLLDTNLRWIKAENISQGQKLIGFDEDNGGEKGQRRKLHSSLVESVKTLRKVGMRLTLSNGVNLVCSTDHGFLVPTGINGGGTVWRHGFSLKIGDRLKVGAPLIQPEYTFDDGWMGGFLDGEGYCAKTSSESDGFCLGWSQLPGPVHDRACLMMKSITDRGYFNQRNDGTVLTSKFTQWPALHAMMQFRPERLIAKRAWEGASITQEPEYVYVTSIDWLGMIDVISIQTSTHTFIAEGICSHNSFNRTYDKSHMERIRPSVLLNYAGGDTDATQQTADVLREQLLEDPELARFYMTIVHPASRAFEKIERRGICLDKEMYQKLGADLTTEINGLQVQVMKQLGGRIVNKHRDKIGSQIDADKSPLVPSIMKDYFFGVQGLNLAPKMRTPKSNEPTMALSHLKMFDHPDAKKMVELLTALNGATKTKSTFVDGFLAHLRPDGRLHPSYMLFHGNRESDDDEEAGSTTGRLSAKDPAIQTLSKKTKWAKRLREAFIAPPGKCVLNLDFSQGELRIVACLAPEPTMLAAYAAGHDLHAVTGAKLGGYDLAEFLTYKSSQDPVLKAIFDKLRDNSKPMNFGLVYGMSAEGFQKYAWALYGKQFTLPECVDMHDAFFELYPGLIDYHENIKKIVHSSAQVRAPFGRIRHLPHIDSWDREVRATAERQGINAPVQSTLTDMMIWAIALIEAEYGDNPDLEVVAMIHDAVVSYVPIEDVELWAKRLTDIMTNLPFKDLDWEPQLRFPVDAEAGFNLANLSKVKLAA